MPFNTVLIANRGEIALRIVRALGALGITSVAVYSDDDRRSLHCRQADKALPLPGKGVAAYLDIPAVLETARKAGCDAIHPGYGFLSEKAEFARACQQAGLTFIGPSAETLQLLGDKLASRRLAHELGIPLLPGTTEATSLKQAHEFFKQQGQQGMIIKALAGGGGRGIRRVIRSDDIEAAYQRCQSEAARSFGNDAVYVEQLMSRARHVEVQVLGDGQTCITLGDRDCSLQRQQQKVIEVAPAPRLTSELRKDLQDAALRMANWVSYQGLGTFEFLVADNQFWFMEANPRLQVEHTITEAISGVDLVSIQIRLAAGQLLADILTDAATTLRGCALQLRINAESHDENGQTLPASGVINHWQMPSGPGVRIDTGVMAGSKVSSDFDSLLAKVIVYQNDDNFPALQRRAHQALKECTIEGVDTNLILLHALIDHPAFVDYQLDTDFINRSHAELFSTEHYKRPDSTTTSDLTTVCSPITGTLSQVHVNAGDSIRNGQIVAIVDAMKMEFEIKSRVDGHVSDLLFQQGELIQQGDPLLQIDPLTTQSTQQSEQAAVDLDAIPANLEEVLQRQLLLLDEQRPEALAKRHKLGMRTARENLDDLLDPGSFNEYGGLAIAGQRQRRKLSELISQSPADGLVAGTGTINAALFGEENSRCLAMSYDYTVFAGTQGMMNHKKTDRMLQLAEQWHLPVVIYAEGGGGRPGETDFPGVAGLDNMTFLGLARLSGKVPLISIVNGRCFAGNAALAGCCDVIIATENVTLGMAGPAMIEGGGLGRYKPEEVGPVSMQAANGVLDLVAKDEAEATALARQYLGYFQGDLADWKTDDQRLLRHLIPENRLRVYDMRQLIDTLADKGSMMELRKAFAPGMITALIRIEGKAFGLIANDPTRLGGAIDSAGSDKASRFMQLCDAFDLPMISLCDTPGFMVGPDSEKTASVRHMSRMFITAASLSIPFFTIVVRKGYGLGAQAMASGSFHAPVFTLAWPSGEFGAMGLEGAVRLGYARELAAIEDPRKREKLFNRMVRTAYQHGKALNMASYLEIDNVIDPQESRQWLLRGLASVSRSHKSGQKRPMIDSW